MFIGSSGSSSEHGENSDNIGLTPQRKLGLFFRTFEIIIGRYNMSMEFVLSDVRDNKVVIRPSYRAY